MSSTIIIPLLSLLALMTVAVVTIVLRSGRDGLNRRRWRLSSQADLDELKDELKKDIADLKEEIRKKN